jgi:hypothetical protein
VAVRVAAHRYVVWLGDDHAATPVACDMAAVRAADPAARFVVFGGGSEGAAAVDLAGRTDGVDLVVTVDSPRSALHGVPAGVAVLDLAPRSDPAAVLAALVTAGDPGRTAVLYDDAVPALRPGRSPAARPRSRAR